MPNCQGLGLENVRKSLPAVAAAHCRNTTIWINDDSRRVDRDAVGLLHGGLIWVDRDVHRDVFASQVRTGDCQGPLSETNYGREHHPRCFSLWLAGGGIKPGISYGKTDDYSYNVIENPVAVLDLHATMQHLLGLDHTQNTYRHQGRDYRLTDVHGNVITDLLA